MNYETPTRRERAFERMAASRVARREAGELRKLWRRCGANVEQFRQEAAAFYREFEAFIAGTMVLEPAEAQVYARSRLRLLKYLYAEEVAQWIEATDESERELVSLWDVGMLRHARSKQGDRNATR